MRRAIAEIVVPSVDEAVTVTVSIGVAAIPDHAGDAAGLVRSADRALYLAKNNGRDRVEMARDTRVGSSDDLPVRDWSAPSPP